MTYLHDLQDNAKNPASGAMLMPNCGPMPKRTCRKCANYREGGLCAEAPRGTTSALEPADDKRCFTPLDPSAKVDAPEVNDTPVLRERRLKRSERYQSKAAREKREEQASKQPADPTPTTRICQRCGRELPLEKFRKQHGGDRIHTCNDCIAESRFGKRDHKPAEAPKMSAEPAVAPRPHKYAAEADGRRKPIPTRKVCVTCGRDLPLDAFPVSASKYSRDGHRNQCIECRDAFYERHRIHRTPEEKKAKRAESDRKYYDKVKARRAEADAPNDADGVRVCQRCGRTLPLDEFQVNARGTRFHACRECMSEARSKGGKTGGRRRKAAESGQAQAEQAMTSIEQARDKALALGLDKVARCLGEAAEAFAELANIMNK